MLEGSSSSSSSSPSPFSPRSLDRLVEADDGVRGHSAFGRAGRRRSDSVADENVGGAGTELAARDGFGEAGWDLEPVGDLPEGRGEEAGDDEVGHEFRGQEGHVRGGGAERGRLEHEVEGLEATARAAGGAAGGGRGEDRVVGEVRARRARRGRRGLEEGGGRRGRERGRSGATPSQIRVGDGRRSGANRCSREKVELKTI